MSSGCLDDLQVLKASENKRDHRLLHELETLPKASGNGSDACDVNYSCQ